jgi:hypothetical protein
MIFFSIASNLIFLCITVHYFANECEYENQLISIYLTWDMWKESLDLFN